MLGGNNMATKILGRKVVERMTRIRRQKGNGARRRWREAGIVPSDEG